MRRLLISFFIGIALLIPAFSATCYFSPYPAAFNVDLKDSATYGGALSSGNIGQDGIGGYANWGSASYNDTTLIAVSGVTEITESEYSANDYYMVVSVQVHGDGWNYVSASEPYLERPFAIDVVNCNSTNAAKRPFVRMGSGGTTEYTSDPIKLEPKKYTTGSWPFEQEWYEAWVDIVLYLPELTGADTSALSADDYYVGLNVRVYSENKESKEQTNLTAAPYVFTFNGYIDDEPDFTDAHIFFNVTPNANANSMDVRQLLLEDASYEVGTYSYETQAFLSGGQTAGGNDKLKYDYQAGNDYYIFASANDVPTSPNNAGFRMYYNGDTTAESFPFIVGLDTATDNTEGSTGSSVIWFDGTDDLTTLDKSDPPKKIQATRVEEDFGFQQGQGKTLYFRDNGTILIDYDENDIENEEEFVTSLSPGVYSTRIYFHIVSTK